MTTSRLLVQYFRNAFDYYVSARHAAKAGFGPVCGSFSHYAVEMFLKGRLSTGRTQKELKGIGHKLNGAWGAFKSEYPTDDLARFDAIVEDIDRFWHIRYPEPLIAEGMQYAVDSSGSAGNRRPSCVLPDADGTTVPRYFYSLHELDDLVHTLLSVCDLNPKFFLDHMSTEAKRCLFTDNDFFAPASSNSAA